MKNFSNKKHKKLVDIILLVSLLGNDLALAHIRTYTTTHSCLLPMCNVKNPRIKRRVGRAGNLLGTKLTKML